MTTSPKNQPAEASLAETEPPVSIPDLAAMDADDFFDHAIAVLRHEIIRQMKNDKTAPKAPDATGRRARDAAALSGLAKTLEQLNALETAREKKGKKAKTKDDAELKDRFVRRLDQLLTGGGTGGVPRKPKRG